MTTKRLVTLIVVGLTVSLIAVGSILWYVRWNSPTKLRIRAAMALKADKPDKALALASSYIAKRPDDWRGYYIMAQAYSRQGKYAEARPPLIKAQPLEPNEPSIILAHAETYSLPATRALSPESRQQPTIQAITDANANLAEAVNILGAFEPADDKSAMQINEAIGLNCRIMAVAQEALSRRLAAEAEVAEASRNTDRVQAKTRASKQAKNEADNHRRKAIRLLLDVVRRDPSRETAAEPLVTLCIRQMDAKSLAEAKMALEKADNPPPMATMALITNELMNTTDRTGAEFARKLDDAIRRMDSLLASHRDNTRLKLTRAGLAMEKRDTATASKLAAELLEVEPRNSHAQLLLARVQMAEGKFAEAERNLFALKADFPNYIEPHYWYAMAADATDKGQLAKEAMRAVTRLEPVGAYQRMLVATARKYLARKLLADFPDRALEDAQECHKNNPNDPEALWLLIEAARKTDRLQLARQTLDDAAAGPDPTAGILLVVAKGYGWLGDRDKALDALNKAASVKPEDADDRYAVAEAMLRTNRTSDAMRLANEAIREDPNSPRAHYVMAMVYEATRQNLQAREHFRKAMEFDSRSTEYRIALAGSLRKAGELEEALAVLKPIVAISKPAKDMEFNIKIFQAKPGEIEATAQESGRPLSQLELAQICLIKGQVQRCIDLCNAELQEQPDSYSGRALLGRALLANSDVDKCIEAWTPLIAAQPDQLPIYRSLAAALSHQAGPQAGPEEVHKSLAAIPGARPEIANAAIAWLCRRSGKHLDAAGFYDKVAQDAASDQAMRYTSRLFQAECLVNANQGDKALEVLDKLIVDKAEKVLLKSTLVAKANLLVRIGRLPEAEATLDKLLLIAKTERDIPSLRSVAQTFVQIGQMDKALTACDAIQSIRPSESSGYLFRAWVLERFGKQDQAGEQYRKAIELNPTDLGIYVKLADNLDARLKPVAAMNVLRELETLGQAGRSQALFSEANLYARWGLKDRAIERLTALDDAAGQSSSPKAQLELGNAFVVLGLTERAKANLVRIPAHAREYVPARLLLARLADTLEQKLAILHSLADRTLANPEIVAQEMAILMADGKPADAGKAFTSFMARLKDKGVMPVAPAALAVTAAIETGNIPLAAQAANMLAGTGDPQWAWTATALAIDVDPNAAARLLPEPHQASGPAAVLGLCLARKTDDPNAARTWTSRLDETLFKATDDQPSSAQADRYRFLCGLLIGDDSRIQPALAKLTSRPSIESRAAKELADHLAKNPPKAADELVTLLKAEGAMGAGRLDLARLWATDALKARPTCQWAAHLLVRMASQQAHLEEVAALLKPTDCYSAKLIRARIFKAAKQYQKATETYASFSQAEKLEPEVALDQGGVEQQAGNLKKALELYSHAWREGKDPAAANNAAYVMANAYVLAKLHPEDEEQLKKAEEQLKEARELAEKAKKAQPRVAYFDTAGWIAHLQGQTDDACRMLRIAVKGMPYSAEVHYHVGLAEAAAGNRGLGRMHLAEAVRIGKELRAAAGKPEPSETAAADLAKQALIEIEPE